MQIFVTNPFESISNLGTFVFATRYILISIIQAVQLSGKLIMLFRYLIFKDVLM
jgi:hypothetical protein